MRARSGFVAAVAVLAAVLVGTMSAASAREPRPRGGTNGCLNTHGNTFFVNRNAEDIQAIFNSAIPGTVSRVAFSEYSFTFENRHMSVAIDIDTTSTNATGNVSGGAEAGYRIRGNRLEVTSVGTSGAEIAVTTGGVSVPPIPVDYSPFGVVGQRIGFTCSGSRFTIFLSTGPITLRREPSPLS